MRLILLAIVIFVVTVTPIWYVSETDPHSNPVGLGLLAWAGMLTSAILVIKAFVRFARGQR
ncbi:MAG: hypothetical protein BGN87_07130 [Rhizobiales bacterium 65-79]|jgi:hypothetical protein|nr:hypothetical protein [Hyphomicrobiales bacterium]OJU02114.1 MAG: hypothetical protein BGN87_07130 [Rhizobiales bacterium 65-79]